MRGVGFTGTQRGLTKEQKVSLGRVLLFDVAGEAAHSFHHGDCVGADEEAHGLASHWGIRIVLHPPDNDAKRAFCVNVRPDLWDEIEVREAKPYLLRNREIVDETEVLVACPGGPEELRSGTWSTVRYARKLGRPVVIVWPDGKVDWWR